MDDIILTIEGKTVTARPGASVLEAALEAGIFIPHLCYHPDLPPVDNCKLCIVEIEGRDGLPTSCTTPAGPGMVVTTTSDRIKQQRQEAIIKILETHPADCGTCIKYLNCELQSLKQYFSTDDLEIHHRGKLLSVNSDNPLFVLDPNKCVLCGRCIRACRDLRGVGILDFQKTGEEEYAGTENNMPLAGAGCRFCGACAEVCPTGAILDKEELTKGKSKKAALVPCRYTCPAEIDVPGYIRAIRAGDYSAAVSMICNKVPFPGVLGHVCDHPCEEVCRRGWVNEPVSIRELKRFAVEQASDSLLKRPDEAQPSSGKKVAVIGSGPAGLTAASNLVRTGHGVTVFEAMPEPGGMLRYGIPEYRLPRQVLEREVTAILETGIEIRTGQRIESLDELLNGGYDAVLVATGTHHGQMLPIPGSDGPGVHNAVDFLQEVHSGEAPDTGMRVVVLGGGSVAFDCARVSKRLGAETVRIACLESREEMLATSEEIAEAEEEGIRLHPRTSSLSIVRDGGAVTGVEIVDVSSFSFDEDGAACIETCEGSQHMLEADTVIFAIGQKPEIPPEFGLDLSERGYIALDLFTQETNKPGVFAAGDVVTGTASVIEAIAAGRKMATAIDRYLGGLGMLYGKKPSAAGIPANIGEYEGFAGLRRQAAGYLTVEERLSGFCPVSTGLTGESARAESERCLQCDLRTAIRPVKFWSDYA